MAYEVFDGTDMVHQLFREGQSVTDEAGDALSQRVIEALNMIGFPRVLRDGFVLRCRNDSGVNGILVRIECRLLAVHRRQIGPQLFRAFVTAIPNVERHDLPCLLVHSDPDPLLVSLCLHEAPHLICFHLETSDEHIPWGRHGPYMEMIRQRRNAGGNKAHEPPNTDADRAANTMERDFLTE